MIYISSTGRIIYLLETTRRRSSIPSGSSAPSASHYFSEKARYTKELRDSQSQLVELEKLYQGDSFELSPRISACKIVDIKNMDCHVRRDVKLLFVSRVTSTALENKYSRCHKSNLSLQSQLDQKGIATIHVVIMRPPPPPLPPEIPLPAFPPSIKTNSPQIQPVLCISS